MSEITRSYSIALLTCADCDATLAADVQSPEASAFMRNHYRVTIDPQNPVPGGSKEGPA